MPDTPRTNSGHAEETYVRPSTPPPRSGAPSDESRFAPGALLASRFRIISLIGSGGMGEVYRADDVKLGQRVALKYIPTQVDPEVLERLYAEVRIGRQVSHPNVCRLYDIVEVDGAHFIAMEYVDGEDLASLLRRIGRLPAEKAVAVARDICAGLAAAHDRGVVHRDLKPANIMIDGRGIARITDFGLAAAYEELSEKRDFAGTPAYMSPEQLADGEVTQRSDIYALGLVLYELFTGRRLFDGRTVAEIREQHSSAKSRPSSVVEGMDAAVERVILRCLEEAPAMRPASVHAVMAALPGGDPLQAAIDAGETPSPEMVAAAGRVGDLAPRTAWMLLLAVFLALGGAIALHRFATIEGYVGRPKSPDVLKERARDILRGVAGVPEPVGTGYGYSRATNYLRYLSSSGDGFAGDLVRRAEPSPMQFSYRGSPASLVAAAAHGVVLRNDPPFVVPGMARVQLDSEGRLLAFEVVPPQHSVGPIRAGTFDWSPALAETGLDLASLSEVTPEWTPPVASDRQYAWTATYAAHPERTMRVEAATYRGLPVFFEVIGPWRPRTVNLGSTTMGATIQTVLTIVVLLVGVLFARRNLRLGRGDRKGSYRLAIFAAVMVFVAGMSIAKHTADVTTEWALIERRAGLALFSGLMCWIFYVALEPYVRRRWPHMLISSTRLLAGRVRDPLVGRDVLLGVLTGIVSASILEVVTILPYVGGAERILRSTLNHAGNVTPLGVAFSFQYAYTGILFALGWLFLYAIFRRLMRNDIAAVVGIWLLVGFTNISRDPLWDIAVIMIAIGPLVVLFWRAGALATAVGFLFYWVTLWTPLTVDFSQWYALRSTTVVLAIVAISVYAFKIALAGKPLFGTFALDEEVAVR
jgi:tRNA A-37 threonylcarbamoyl transferase component Bud32